MSDSQPLTRIRLRLIRWHRPQMLQIALVPYQHDDDVQIGVVSQLLQPSLDVLVCPVFGYVVY